MATLLLSAGITAQVFKYNIIDQSTPGEKWITDPTKSEDNPPIGMIKGCVLS